jgi:hypothetical protein
MNTAQLVFEDMVRGGATGSDVTVINMSHVTEAALTGSDRVRMCNHYILYYYNSSTKCVTAHDRK